MKRGMSGVILTIIMIGLVLVSVSIVWGLVSNLLSDKAEDISSSSLGLSLKIVKYEDDGSGNLKVFVERGVGKGSLAGIDFIVGYKNGSTVEIFNDSELEELGSLEVVFDGVILADVAKISLAPVILSSSGETLTQNIVEVEEINYVPVCGDGKREGEEVCDDGINNGAYDGCMPGCSSLGPYCGDGIKNGVEECDGDSNCYSNCSFIVLPCFQTDGTQSNPGLSCKDLLDNCAAFEDQDGLYYISINGGSAFQVYCDMTKDDGGWTLVARALAGLVSHETISSYGTLISPSQSSVAKLSHSDIIRLGKSSNPSGVYAIRFNFDKVYSPNQYYFQWNNGYAPDFNTNLALSSSPYNQTRKTSYGSSWTNSSVPRNPGCPSGNGPFAIDSQCWPMWGYSIHAGAHSGFGVNAAYAIGIYNGTETSTHRNGTMWVR